MTRAELSRLYYLNKRISIDKRHLEELRAAAERTTTRITGLPHVSTRDAHSSEAIKIALAEQEELVRLQVQQSVIEYRRLTRWLSEIEDPYIYAILNLRYVHGLKWRDVAQRLGGNNTEVGVRIAAQRYIEKTCSE